MLELEDHVQQPAITQSCRVVRNNLSQLFYSQNTFAFTDSGSSSYCLRTWLEAIGPANYQQIAKLSLVSAESDLVPYIQEEFFESAGIAMTVKSSQNVPLGLGTRRRIRTKCWLVFQKSD